jgi:FkbM family methyltransferase
MNIFEKNFKAFLLLPIYYLIHRNLFFGFFHKKFIKKFYYRNFIFDLDINGIPLVSHASFFFKTYEINDRILIERNLKKNKCIIVGAGIGFIPTIAYHLTKKKILVFEINSRIIDNLNLNLNNNNCKFFLYNKNISFINKKKNTKFFIKDNFLGTSQFFKTKDILNVKNIFYKNIKNIKNYDTLIIDAEGAEYNFLINLNKLNNIKHIFFELHYDLLSKKKIKKIFSELHSNSYELKDKFLNSFYFKRIKV